MTGAARVIAVVAAGACAARQPGSAPDQLTLSDELRVACRGASGPARVQACLDGIAQALDGNARSGAFNGLAIAPDSCWSVTDTAPAMRHLCQTARTGIEASRRRPAIELCDGGLILLRTVPEAGGTTTYNLRIRLIEAHAMSRDCAYAAVQWSTYAMVDDPDGAVRLISDDTAYRLAAAIRPELDQLQRRTP